MIKVFERVSGKKVSIALSDHLTKSRIFFSFLVKLFAKSAKVNVQNTITIIALLQSILTLI